MILAPSIKLCANASYILFHSHAQVTASYWLNTVNRSMVENNLMHRIWWKPVTSVVCLQNLHWMWSNATVNKPMSLPSNQSSLLYMVIALLGESILQVPDTGTQVLARGWHSYTLTRWSVGHVWQDKNQSVQILCIYTTIHTYMLVHEKTRLRPISHWTFMTSLVCKVGLYYSSASINQLFNTKNSFLQLLSRKAALKCEVLFKSVFSQTSSHEIVRRNVELTRENLNLDSKIKHLSPVYTKRHQKAAQTTAKLVSPESKNEPNTT